MKKIKFLALTLIATMSFCLLGCKNDEPYDGETILDGQSIEIKGFGNDATASYPLHFRLTFSNGYLIAVGDTSSLTAEALAVPGMTSRVCPTAVSISDVGKVRSLNKIDEYPAESTFKDSVQVIEEHGYVIEAHGNAKLDAYQHPDLHDPAPQYMRLWIEEAIDGGWHYRYEFPFVPED